MTDRPQRNLVRPLIALVAFMAVALPSWHYWSIISGAPSSRFDDSYMFIRYAKHILAGDGPAWNPGGEATYGITSLLHLFVITILRWTTSLSDGRLVILASAGSGVAAVIAMVVSAGRFSEAEGLRRNYLLWAGLLFPTVLIAGPFMYHSVTGMDTMLAVFMHSVLIFVTLRLVELGTARTLWPVVLAAYLAFLTRPDSAFYAAFFPAAAILLLTDARRRIRLLLIFWIALGLVFVVDAGIKYLVFGVPVPLPTFAKMHGHYTEYAGHWRWNPVKYLFVFAAAILPFLCFGIAFTKRRSLRLLTVFLAPTILTLSTYFNMVQIMGSKARFSFPALPFFVIASVLMLDRFVASWQRGARISRLEVASRALLIILLIAVLPAARYKLVPMYDEKLIAQDSKSTPVQNPGGLPELGYWDAVSGMIQLAKNAPPGSLFCMSEYGALGAAAPDLVIYDPLGLHDSQTAREGFSSTILFDRDPDLIWMPHPDYVEMRREMMSADEFWSNYDFYPAAFRFGVAIRKAGERSPELHRHFARAWKEYYPDAPMAKHYLAR